MANFTIRIRSIQSVRLATTQCRTTNNIAENLAQLVSLIEQAAEVGTQLIVTPEFGNRTIFHTDQKEAWEVSVTLDSDYVRTVQEAAATSGIHAVFNATRRGEDSPEICITNGHNSCALDEPYNHIPVRAAAITRQGLVWL